MRSAGAGAALLPLYACALFVSALLAFWIQPLFAKLLLPRYGGSPAVWTTASLFFQVALLGGYLYAHLVSRAGLRAQLAIHSAFVALALATLPVALSGSASPDGSPVWALLTVLALSVGVPVFALSATAPLLQQWFARSGHPHAGDPYFLYSASNAGSLLALLGFPFLLEPALGLREQTVAWSASCAVFAVLVFACATALWRNPAANTTGALRAIDDASHPAEPLRASTVGRWLLLAAAPSSLMLGVTQHITSEIAAAPLLWLIPLTLYILTFVLAFARSARVPDRLIGRLQPPLAILLVLVWPLNHYTGVLVLHLIVFGVTTLMCHLELARTRPPVAHLTVFYLCLALGGALGGVFNALIAPLVFESVLEYPLALALASALRASPTREKLLRTLAPAVAFVGAFAALLAFDFKPFASAWSAVVYLQIVGVGLYLTSPRPHQFGPALLVVLLATPIVHAAERVLERHRSFFGVHSVLEDETGRFNVLMHGITIHGAQFRDPALRTRPTTYFHSDSPIGHVLSLLGRDHALQRVAVVGMGAGTLACHQAPQRQWTFFEIDPVVVSLARDPRFFSFLSLCAPDARIVVGDGRLKLVDEAAAAFDLLVIDTFSSDAIPAHMLTREALALYLSRIDRGGVVAMHITNQFLNLVPVLARLVADAGVHAVMPGPRLDLALDERLAALPSSWVVIARNAERLQPLIDVEGWIALPAATPGRVWTDDFSNVLGALK